MSVLRKAKRTARFSKEDWGLLLRAVQLMARIRLALWFQHPTSVLRRAEALIEGRRETVPPHRRVPVPRIAWAVRAAARRVPRATCLVQALAARALFTAHGHDAILRIGVARGESFEAHAWVEVDGVRVVGGMNSERYAPLPDLTPALRERREGSTNADGV